MDEVAPPLELQVQALRKMEEVHHAEVINKIALLQDQIQTTTAWHLEASPSKRLKLDLNCKELAVSDRMKRTAGTSNKPSSPQLGFVMKGFMATLIQCVIKEASRKATSSKSLSCTR